MKSILCFGDSNTFGTNPKGGRHPRDQRWPGILQKLLGEDYYVIEEGMGGRTTVWDDPLNPNRSGLAALPISLQSHKPLDLVILSLGTNDCKGYYNASPKVIARAVESLCKCVQSFDYGPGACKPKILVISPIWVGTDLDRCPYVSYDESSVQKSRQLAPLYEETARAFDCLFLDAAKVAGPSETDQLHMVPEGHMELAKAVADVVKGWFEA